MVQKIKTPDNVLDLNVFVENYSEAYFLGKNKIHGIRYQQTCENAENEILNKLDVWKYESFKKLMAWKMGRIKHQSSREEGEIKYYKGWIIDGESNPEMYGRTIDLKGFHDRLCDEKKTIETYINTSDVENAIKEIVNCKVRDSYIGPVYAITILCFISGGKYPIYDRFVLSALNAIKENRYPKNTESIPCQDIDKVIEIYKSEYIPGIDKLLKQLKKTTNNHLAYRQLDRALWVYGHGFK